MSARNGTPLTRRGSRVPTVAAKPTPVRTATAVARPTTAAAATRTTMLPPAPAAVPEAVVRTMIVCVTEELSPVLGSTRHLERHLGVAGTSCPRYWASSALRPWQRRQLIDLRTPSTGPRYCAGGPIRLLDLDGTRSTVPSDRACPVLAQPARYESETKPGGC